MLDQLNQADALRRSMEDQRELDRLEIEERRRKMHEQLNKVKLDRREQTRQTLELLKSRASPTYQEGIPLYKKNEKRDLELTEQEQLRIKQQLELIS